MSIEMPPPAGGSDPSALRDPSAAGDGKLTPIERLEALCDRGSLTLHALGRALAPDGREGARRVTA